MGVFQSPEQPPILGSCKRSRPGCFRTRCRRSGRCHSTRTRGCRRQCRSAPSRLCHPARCCSTRSFLAAGLGLPQLVGRVVVAEVVVAARVPAVGGLASALAVAAAVGAAGSGAGDPRVPEPAALRVAVVTQCRWYGGVAAVIVGVDLEGPTDHHPITRVLAGGVVALVVVHARVAESATRRRSGLKQPVEPEVFVRLEDAPVAGFSHCSRRRCRHRCWLQPLLKQDRRRRRWDRRPESFRTASCTVGGRCAQCCARCCSSGRCAGVRRRQKRASCEMHDRRKSRRRMMANAPAASLAIWKSTSRLAI